MNEVMPSGGCPLRAWVDLYRMSAVLSDYEMTDTRYFLYAYVLTHQRIIQSVQGHNIERWE